MRGNTKTHRGFTLSELLLVTAVLAVLAGILMTALGPARRMARAAACTSNLRQIGMAYKLYEADYGAYPRPAQLTASSYVSDRRVLFCPEDDSFAARGAASSYRFRLEVPPRFLPITQVRDLDPNVVLAGCLHHTGQKLMALRAADSRARVSPFPFHLVLRAGGSVQRVRIDRVKLHVQPGPRPIFTMLYPGEPGYAESGS